MKRRNFLKSAAAALAMPASKIVVTTSSLPGATVGRYYTETLHATGGKPPYTWSISSGALPTGLTLSKSGVISGTPTKVELAKFVVKATDSSHPAQSAERPMTLT